MYSMINQIAATVNTLIDRQKKLENDINSVSNQHELSNKIADIEKLLPTLSSISAPSLPDLKPLYEELKNIKQSLLEMSKEKSLLETNLTLKYEQYVNRVFKERVDTLVKDAILKNNLYFDEQLKEIRGILKSQHVDTIETDSSSFDIDLLLNQPKEKSKKTSRKKTTLENV